MQFGFMPGRSTTDTIFIVRQLQEKFCGVNNTLYMAFVDLEKAFDRVHVSSGGLFASSALMSGWCDSYWACMKTQEAECVLVATWVKVWLILV